MGYRGNRPTSKKMYLCPLLVQLYTIFCHTLYYTNDKTMICVTLLHVYSNMLKFFPPKNEQFQIKQSDIFHISAQNIDCGYSFEPSPRGGSNEYPQSILLSRKEK